MNSLKSQLIKVCHLLYAKGFVSATDGNVSVKVPNGDTILATATSVNKGMVTEEDLIEVDIHGKVISGSKKPSTELAMHLYIYRIRSDINAVVHAHPPYATGFATARQALTGCLFPEVIIGLGAVPLADYATPSTLEVVKSIEPFVEKTEAILLANHGVVTYGSDLLDAFFKMEKVEHAAHITFVARLLGGEKYLSKQDVEKLKAISEATYGKSFSEKLACETSDDGLTNDSTRDKNFEDSELKSFIKKIITGE